MNQRATRFDSVEFARSPCVGRDSPPPLTLCGLLTDLCDPELRKKLVPKMMEEMNLSAGGEMSMISSSQSIMVILPPFLAASAG